MSEFREHYSIGLLKYGMFKTPPTFHAIFYFNYSNIIQIKVVKRRAYNKEKHNLSVLELFQHSSGDFFFVECLQCKIGSKFFVVRSLEVLKFFQLSNDGFNLGIECTNLGHANNFFSKLNMFLFFTQNNYCVQTFCDHSSYKTPLISRFKVFCIKMHWVCIFLIFLLHI